MRVHGHRGGEHSRDSFRVSHGFSYWEALRPDVVPHLNIVLSVVWSSVGIGPQSKSKRIDDGRQHQEQRYSAAPRSVFLSELHSGVSLPDTEVGFFMFLNFFHLRCPTLAVVGASIHGSLDKKSL